MLPSKTITDPIDRQANLLIGAWKFWSKEGTHDELVGIVGKYVGELDELLEERYGDSPSEESEESSIDERLTKLEEYVDANEEELDVLDMELYALGASVDTALDEIAEEAGELFAEQERKIQALISVVKSQHEAEEMQQELIEALLTATGLVTHEERQEARDEAGFAKGDRVYHIYGNPENVGTVISTDDGNTTDGAKYLRVEWDNYGIFREHPKYMKLK